MGRMNAILEPSKPLSERAMLNLLRETVPCPSGDPMVKDAYEHALHDWIGLPEWQRLVHGFDRYLASALATMI